MIIVCNGMMRAGSTLQYNLARCLVERMGMGEGEGFFISDELSNRKLTRWANDKRYHIIKMHDIHSKAVEMVSRGSIRFFYIYRDIRDVAVSAKRKFRYKDQESFLEVLDLTVATYYEIKKIPDVLWQKYEDVVNDIPAAIRAQANFLSLEPTGEIVSAVERDCSLETILQLTSEAHNTLRFKIKYLLNRPNRLNNKLKALLGKLGISIYMHDRRTLLYRDHISKDKGQIGVWREGLTREAKAIIEERYRLWLQETGYSL